MSYPIGLPLEEARNLILENCIVLKSERVVLEEAEGRVLAEDIIARENLPPFSRSPYDGYALRAADTMHAGKENPIALKIIEEVPAGYAPKKVVGIGQATKILTGAPIPDGANAVVKFEDTKFTAETVVLSKSCHCGENIVPEGEDIRIGSVVASKGMVLDSAFLGILAGLGCTQVDVVCKPRVELISMGDELLPVDAPLAPGKIRNSSIYTLASFVRRCGAHAHCCGIVHDQEQLIADAVSDAAKRADVVLTTGGVSVGDYDKMLNALQILDAKILFWKVQMKPGAPFVAAVYQEKLILCLSGNPSAAAIAYFLLGIPALRKMQGRNDIELKKIQIFLANDFKKASPNRRFIPGRLEVREGRAYLLQTEKQGNGMLHPLHKCTILGELPAGSPPMESESLIDGYSLFE